MQLTGLAQILGPVFKRQAVPILRINMVTNGIDFVISNRQLLILDTRSSSVVIMSRSLKAISGTQLVLCDDKMFACFFIAPDKGKILKSNIRKHELSWTDFLMSI